MFGTTSFSYHGHPHPLACPGGRTRKSIALYYYSNGRPPGEIVGDHNTLFRDTGPVVPPSDPNWKAWARRVAPPLAVDAVRALRSRRR